jgi:hypothetical protein
LNKTGEALADAYWSIIPLGTPVRYRMTALDLHTAITELIEPTVSFKCKILLRYLNNHSKFSMMTLKITKATQSPELIFQLLIFRGWTKNKMIFGRLESETLSLIEFT